MKNYKVYILGDLHPLRRKSALDMYDLFWDDYQGVCSQWALECLVPTGILGAVYY